MTLYLAFSHVTIRSGFRRRRRVQYGYGHKFRHAPQRRQRTSSIPPLFFLSVFHCHVPTPNQASVRPSAAPLRFFFILIPFPSFLPIYLSRHSDCHHHRSHPRRLLLLHSERQSDARFATSRLTCSPHRGSFAATCSPSANAAAAFSASLASVSICSSASRSRCC